MPLLPFPFYLACLMSGFMSDHDENFQPEDDGSLEYWMWCELEEANQMLNSLEEFLDGSDICPKCGKQGGEYTPTLDECAFC